MEAVLVTLEICICPQKESKWRQSGVGSVRVSYGCCKQLPQTGWLKTVLAYPVTLLEVRSVRWVSRSWPPGLCRAVFPSGNVSVESRFLPYLRLEALVFSALRPFLHLQRPDVWRLLPSAHLLCEPTTSLLCGPSWWYGIVSPSPGPLLDYLCKPPFAVEGYTVTGFGDEDVVMFQGRFAHHKSMPSSELRICK